MREAPMRAGGLLLAVLFGSTIAWLYAHQPSNAAEVSGGLAALVHAYRIDRQSFDDGVRFFHEGNFEAARAALGRADPARQDPRTQFYVAYSCYREGWGRVYIDRAQYSAGLDAVDRAIAVVPGGRLIVDDPALQIHSADELRAELSYGLAHPVHPLAIFSSRK